MDTLTLDLRSLQLSDEQFYHLESKVAILTVLSEIIQLIKKEASRRPNLETS
jgi:hypothetical protein